MKQLLPSLSRTELIRLAEGVAEAESFEKDGCVWVGSLGLKFDREGRLVHVARSWNSGKEDPCYPQ